MTTAALSLNRVLAPLGDCLTRETAERIVAFKLESEVEDRLEDLATRNTEGELSPDELEEYHTCVSALEFVAILQAKARLKLRQASS